MARPISERLAVCSWSLQPPDPDDLIAKLVEIGIKRVQLSLDPIREGGAWAGTPAKLADAGVEVVSGMVMTVGEDYSTPQAIQATGGVVPDATWPQSWQNIQEMAELAQGMGLGLVTMHAGFLPHETTDPSYEKLAGRIDQIAAAFAERGLTLGFETGQEDAPTLLAFLDRLGRDNVGINFDPANMILYDMGDPIAALEQLMPRVVQIHIKDGTRTQTPGAWGSEDVVGTGQVDWPAFFAVLEKAGYEGDLCIEREAGDHRVADIIAAKDFVVGLG